MDAITNNVMSMGEQVNFNSAGDYVFDTYEDNYKVLTAGETASSLDFGHVTSPDYIKLSSTLPVNLTVGGVVMNNVESFEMKGEVPAMSVDNASSLEENTVRFLVANEE